MSPAFAVWTLPSLDVRGGTLYLLFASYLLVGWFVHERWRMRLGGVLVLPFLVVYSLQNLAALTAFTIAAVATFVVGEGLHRWTLIYGRRMLIAFLIVSLTISFALNSAFGLSQNRLFMPLIPGLFAYNLHRETRPVWNSVVFAGWLLILFVITFAAAALIGTNPPATAGATR